MKNVAVILAGGSGKRLGSALPKQFLDLAGKKIIEYSISAFEENQRIDEILIVCNSQYIDYLQKIIDEKKYLKVKKILNGGKERSDSSLAAINHFNENVNLIFHDAVRPFVSQKIINECIDSLEKYKALTVALPSTDTIVKINSQNEVEEILERKSLVNVQTPQAFHWDVIKEAYSRALQDKNFIATDDSSVVKKYMSEITVHIVEGESDNIKITYEKDLLLAETILNKKNL